MHLKRISGDSLRTFLYSYNPVELLVVHSITSGFSKGSFGSQYSIIPPTSTEMTVSYRALYYKKATGINELHAVLGSKLCLTAIRWTLDRCSLSNVCSGVPSPLPSYNRIADDSKSVLYKYKVSSYACPPLFLKLTLLVKSFRHLFHEPSSMLGERRVV